MWGENCLDWLLLEVCQVAPETQISFQKWVSKCNPKQDTLGHKTGEFPIINQSQTIVFFYMAATVLLGKVYHVKTLQVNL